MDGRAAGMRAEAGGRAADGWTGGRREVVMSVGGAGSCGERAEQCLRCPIHTLSVDRPRSIPRPIAASEAFSREVYTAVSLFAELQSLLTAAAAMAEEQWSLTTAQGGNQV